MTTGDQTTVDTTATRPRLIDKHQLPTQRLELAHRSPQRSHVAADLTVMANLAAFVRNSDINRFLVHVHTHVQLARLVNHGLPPVFRLTPSCSTCGSAWFAPRNPRYQAGRPPPPDRKPLCLTGRRSVGKSFLIRLLQHTPSLKSSYEQPKSSCKALNEVTKWLRSLSSR